MLCLGIESSCDDSCVALVQDGKLIAEQRNSQARIHALFGGVVPELASREHSRIIGPLCDKLFEESGYSLSDLDLISVARGPGLLGSLLVGVSFAKSLALGTGARIIGVNHLHAHLMVAELEEEIKYPALGLLVSGGHTHLYRIEGCENFELLGKSLDDAAGEAFDKAGKMMGLPYPAGRAIDDLSKKGKSDDKLFPRPYLANQSLDFSFSGLKTSMQYYLKKNTLPKARFDPLSGELFIDGDAQLLYDLCASYSSAIIDTLVAKTQKAVDFCTEINCPSDPNATSATTCPSDPNPINDQKAIKSLILAGGVAANSGLRSALEGLAEKNKLKFFVPRLSLCADNAVMVAYFGEKLAEKGYSHGLGFEAIPKGRSVPDDFLFS